MGNRSKLIDQFMSVFIDKIVYSKPENFTTKISHINLIITIVSQLADGDEDKKFLLNYVGPFQKEQLEN